MLISPLVGGAAIAGLIWEAVNLARAGQSADGNGFGMVLAAHTPAAAIGTAALLSAALALLNMLPLSPLDGGRIVHAAVTAWRGSAAADRFSRLSMIGALVVVLGVPLATDVLHLIGVRL